MLVDRIERVSTPTLECVGFANQAVYNPKQSEGFHLNALTGVSRRAERHASRQTSPDRLSSRNGPSTPEGAKSLRTDECIAKALRQAATYGSVAYWIDKAATRGVKPDNPICYSRMTSRQHTL